MTTDPIPPGAPASRHGRFPMVPAIVCLLSGLYIVYFSWLTTVSHEAFQTSALDLGYTSQVVWNTLHGHLLEFSTFEGIKMDLPLDAFRRTDILLSYHVELLLIPISILYAIYASPVTLLIFQSLVLGLGALPAFWLARDHLGSELAGLVFAVAYLLAPALQGANLSDFHAVALTAPLLLLAFVFVKRHRYGAFLAVALVAMIAKEDIPLLIVMIGLYLFFWHGQRRIGAVTALMGMTWFVVCTRLILPYFSGLSLSPFTQRLAIFGPTVSESAARLLRDPMLVMQWLARPEIITYVAGLLATGGFMALFSPAILFLSTPVAITNIFSNWGWTYSEGAHYSASLVPFIIAASIYGLGVVANALCRWLRLPRQRVVLALTGVVLAISAFHHVQIGVTPLAGGFHRPQMTEHHRLIKQVIASIPVDAAISTQSSLYPHLSLRRYAYLFPVVNDAEYVLVDVTSSPYPSNIAEVSNKARALLVSQDFRLLVAEDGLLLFKREANSNLLLSFPAPFTSFARAQEDSVRYPLLARFGDVLELVGYDYTLYSQVHARELPVKVTTYWRALKPLSSGYRFVFSFTRADGAIVGQYDGETAATIWYRPDRWRVGELIRIETPDLPIGRLRDVIVAVSTDPNDPHRVQSRLRPIMGDNLPLLEDGSLLKLFSFP